jgi:hypothetical protein
MPQVFEMTKGDALTPKNELEKVANLEFLKDRDINFLSRNDEKK